MTATAAPNPVAYRPKQAAQALRIGVSTLYRRIAAGEIKTTKFGGATLIPYSEVVRVSGGSTADVTN